MSTPELRDALENELKRVLIQNHSNYAAWYSSLGSHARQVLENILEEDVTPELIIFSQQAPEEEWDQSQFLRVIGEGNPNPEVALSLTNFSLGDILTTVRDFGKPGK